MKNLFIGGLILWALIEMPKKTIPIQEQEPVDDPFPPANLCITKLCENGTCDPATGQCICVQGWSGENCDIENSFEPNRIYFEF